MIDIDVIIPVRDVDDFLDEAIDSCLNQTVVSTWVTVVDAGSTTPITLLSKHEQSSRVQLLRSSEPLLVGAARNLGIANTSRAFVSFLDADDVWPVERSADLAVALSHSKADLAVGQVLNFGQAESGLVIPDEIKTAFLAGGVLMPRNTFTKVGPFDETLRAGEYIEWHNRFTRAGLVTCILPKVVLHRRVHRKSSTATAAIEKLDSRDDYLRVVRQWMNKND